MLQVAVGLPARSQGTAAQRRVNANLVAGGNLNGSAQPTKATDSTIDWSTAMVESTMKRYSTAKDLGSWGYAKSLYLYGQYLVWKRTHYPELFEYVKAWVDFHLDENASVINTNAEGKGKQITFDNLDSMLPEN